MPSATDSLGATSVIASRAGAVGQITLNRPDSYNAITIELARSLERALIELAADTHVIVIRGAGGNFCAGGDFNQLQALRADGEGAMRELFEAFGAACAAVAAVPVPVIAAVEGYAMAGGFELMQACDIVLVREDAKIGDNHSNFGQVPGGGSSQRLPRLVGAQRALALILSGDRLSGPEAVAWGLAYRSLPAAAFEAEVQAFAERIAAKSPAALARAKHLIRDGLELPLEQGLQLELATVLGHLADTSAAEGMERFTSRGGSER
jgi:enoyl-CoA hydratase